MIKRVTLRDIARIAEVHVTTVSLALRNHPRIPESTRRRIKALADKMKYRPDPVLASLMVYRQSTRQRQQEGAPIAYVTGDGSRHEWKKEPSLYAIYNSAKSRAEARGYRLEEFWIREPGITLQRWNRLFVARGINSILIAPWIRGKAHLRLDWSLFHCVKIGYSLVFPTVHTVENNQFQCMQLCMRRLRSKGYRRPGFANRMLEDERLNHFYKAAFLIEQERCAPEYRVPPFIPRVWRKDLFVAWYKRHRPDVVICPDLEGFQWLHSLGISIPAKLGYANLDWRDSEPEQSGIRQAHKQVGEVAMDLLISLIHSNERGLPPNPHLTQVEGDWVDGSTTR